MIWLLACGLMAAPILTRIQVAWRLIGNFRGVDAGAVVWGDDAVDGGVVFQAFGEFQRRWGPGDELNHNSACVAADRR